MNDDRKKRQATVVRVKEALVDALMAQPDEQILAHAAQDGINPDEVRSRVLDAFRKASHTVNRPVGPEAKKKPTVLNIDAAQARAILKRVASRTRSPAVPLPIAAQLDQVKGDEAIRIVTELKDMGILSDDELK
jgi:hypothetical protein